MQIGWRLEHRTKHAIHANNMVTMPHQIPDNSNNDNTISEVNSDENTIVSQMSIQSPTYTMRGCIQRSVTTKSDLHETSITHSDPFFRMSGALEQHTSWSSKCTVSACYSMSIYCTTMLEFIAKLDDLVAVCLTCNPDVICIVESWLYADNTDDEISLPNYSIVRLDRNRNESVIVMYMVM